MDDLDLNRTLVWAVRKGRLERVREIINSFGLSYSQGWSEGFFLLCDAINNRHTEVVKLLLTFGSQVNNTNTEPTNTPLHFAAINGDIQIVEMLLNRGAKINAKNYYGQTPLHNALTRNEMEITALLVNQGADVNATNNYGITPLHYALETCSEEIINYLLARIANVNAKDVDGRTYIHIAAKRGCLQIVNHLIKHGAYVNSAFREGCTPLCLAVVKGNEKVVQLLLEHGANVHAQHKCGKTILHFAVEKGHEIVVQLLLERGANVHAQHKCGKTILHFAVEKGHEIVVKLLIDCGANVDAEDKDRKTVLYWAVEQGHEKFVKLLLECGANVDAQDRNGKTVLHCAVEKGHSVIVEHVLKHCPDVNNKSNRSSLNTAVLGIGEEHGLIVEILLQYGFTVNPEDVNNSELLHAAVKRGYLKVVEELLKYGTDVNMLYIPKYGIGYTPLHVAANFKQEEVAKLLISYGADVNARGEDGCTAIVYAAENADLKITKLLLANKANVQDNPEVMSIAVQEGCRGIIEVLLQHGADVNASDENGITALHFSALGKDDDNVKGEIAKLLLIGGAVVNAKTETDMTPLHFAAENGHLECIKVLLKFGASIDPKDKYGRTPLHFAALYRHVEAVEAFLKCGADVDSKDEFGITALHIASDKGDEEIVTALVEHGSDMNIVSELHFTLLDFATTDLSLMGLCHGHVSGISDCRMVTEICLRHMVKMEAVNLYQSEEKLLPVSCLSGFREECEEEIASMKSEMVRDNKVTFYDILTKGVRQLAVYARDGNMVQVLRSDDYKTQFPIYASMININFRKGEIRKELLEQGNKSFHFLFNNFPQLPHVCTEKIFSYLSDKDIRILIDACKCISIQHY